MAQDMKELIAYIAKALVDAPDAVQVDEYPADDGDGTVLELCVAEPDLGQVIGRQGRTAKAMRQLLIAASTKAKTRVLLDIVEP